MSRNSYEIAQGQPISPPQMARRGKPISSFTPSQRGAASVIANFESSSSIEEVLIEAEEHTEQAPTVTSDVTESLPFQQLLQTEITIQFGSELDQKRTVFLEFLKCYSGDIKDLFDAAEPRFKDYQQGKLIRTQVKSLLPPETPYDRFAVGCKDAGRLVVEAMNLIIRCIGNYPLKEYQHAIKKCLAKATAKLFADKNMWKSAPSANDLRKKEKDYDPIDHLRDRLQVLNSEATLSVLSELYCTLSSIKYEEARLAKTNNIKAAAQRTLLLPGVDLDTISPLIQWLYQGKLVFQSANQLCKLFGLAEKLGVTNLAQTCLSRLSTETFDKIQAARTEALDLSVLMEQSQASVGTTAGETQDPLAGIVWTVFKFVLGHKEPPLELQNLVVNAIADSADIGLLKKLAPQMSHRISQQLNMAQMSRLYSMKPYHTLIAKQDIPNSQGDRSEYGSYKTELCGLGKLEGTPDSQLVSEVTAPTTSQDSMAMAHGEHHQLPENYT